MKCSYCGRTLQDDEGDDALQCLQCHLYVHVKCLHTYKPGDLLGDVFFDFTCADCTKAEYDNSPSTSSSVQVAMPQSEKLVRQRLSWFMVITLALYNLSIKSKGLGHHGYFHWRSHIVSFINKNWDYLFEPTTRRRKNWIGSISGNLSHNSPEFFVSSQEAFQKSGWWKLKYANRTPKYIYKKYEEFCQKRSQQRVDKRQLEDKGDLTLVPRDALESKRIRHTDSEDDVTHADSCSRTIPYMGRKPKVAKQLNIIDDDLGKSLQQQQEQPLSIVQSSLMDFLAENLANDDLGMFNHLPSITAEEKHDFLPLLESANDHVSLFDVPDIKDSFDLNGHEASLQEPMDGKLKSFYHTEQQPKMQGYSSEENFLQDDYLQTASDYSNEAEEDAEYQPRILQVTNFQQLDSAPADAAPQYELSDLKKEIKSDAEQSENEEVTPNCNGHIDINKETDDTRVLAPCKPSLFTKQPRRNWPWLVQKASDDEEGKQEVTESISSLTMISEYEEKELLQKLRKIFDVEEKCKLQIPVYIRRFYRKLCVREWKREHGKLLFNVDDYVNGNRCPYQDKKSKSHIIDRYQLISLSTQDSRKSFYARIAGSIQYELFQSPYTQRILHPFIYRNRKCFPPWLKLMCEVQYAVTGNIPKRAPIDFCYVRPNHIAAVNALLQTVFWPGIDMSECLTYPDFSVVALYKKLVVGCGFLVPDVGFNEAYISFMAVRPGWQRCGIGTFMLYHLIQTCMSKDITLHVSATNPAVVLYQKFGFKIEEVILDFYDKYLPINSKHSRNAFFLRLMR